MLMKKYLLILVGVVLSFIYSETQAQNSITVTVFDDTNYDGIDNDGFIVPGITNAELQLFDSGGTPYNHVEGPAGVYVFDNGGAGLPDETYYFVYTETPWTAAGDVVRAITLQDQGTEATDSDADRISGTSSSVVLSGGSQMEVDLDLGLVLVTAIGDFVFEDTNGDGLSDGEPGIAGVTVSLLDGTGAGALDTDGNPVAPTATDGAGNYIFGNLPQGEYIVEFTLPTAPTTNGNNWVATTFNNTDPDFSNDSDADPTNSLRSPVYNTMGNIFLNENIDAGFFVPVKVGDFVFCDINGNGINDGEAGVEGVTVTLTSTTLGALTTDAEGNPLANPVTTDAAGMYMFDILPPGEYFIDVDLAPTFPEPPFVFTGQDIGGDENTDSDVNPTNGVSPNFTMVSDDLDKLDLDAGIYQEITIEGNVWFDQDDDFMLGGGEGGPGGVLIELFDSNNGAKIDEVNTGAGGVYLFENVPPGTYYMQIGSNNFITGGALNGTTGCPGANDPGDMVDNDDNAPDSEPGDVVTAPFVLESNCDKDNPPVVEYIDFCFGFDCDMPNALASLSCSEIADSDILCDINTLATFCAIMPTGNSPGTQPNPLCPDGGAPHNMSWFAFVAYGGTYSVTVTPTNCSDSGNGNEGVQLGLYTDCTFTEEVYCQSGCSTAPVTFDSSVLEEGQTYYFFIDGCAGSVCSYEVSIQGNPIAPDLTPSDVCIDENGTLNCDDAQYCPDTDVNFIVQGLQLTVDYTWEINTISGTPYAGNPTEVTPDENLIINFPDEGVYEVCLTDINNGCQFWSGPQICKTITIEGLDDELFDPVTICEEDLATFDPSVLEDADAADPMDPNGDGTQGWQGPPAGFDFGTNTFSVTTPLGCTYEQEFEIEAFDDVPDGEFNMVLCVSDLPLQIDELTITELSFGGDPIFTLNDYLMVNTPTVNGCDSVIDITLEQLTILNGSISEGPCLPEGLPLNFVYNESLSTDVTFMTFVWTDPMGNVITDDWNPTDPTDILAPQSGGNGDYTLTITIEKDGTMCTFPYVYTIDFDALLPPVPEIDGFVPAICEGAGQSTYTAINGGDAFAYTWTVSGGATFTTSGANGETITVDWDGTAGGTVTVYGENGCGVSEEVEVEVAVNPQLTPLFDFDVEVCVDSSAVITYAGDPADIMSYTWNFNGGTITNGTGGVGPGPHEVSWPTSGAQDVELTVTDNAGCVSNLTTESINVIEPLTPPTVICNPALGEVTFTWDDVAGALSYEVNVLSGQSGTMDGNSYTVTGLADGETVNIEIIMYTDDACQVVVGSAPACTAQDCVPPTITLTPDETDICLDPNTGTFNVVPDVTTGETGIGVFMGPGIVDTLNGVFDPDSANIGTNTIFYNFVTDDGCIGQQSTTITVNATPQPSFTTVLDTICVTETLTVNYDGTANVATYDWDYGTDGTGTGGANPDVTFTSAGVKTISLVVVKDGCESEMFTADVFVQPELEPIDVVCENQDLNSVTFGWDPIDGATGYEVIIGTDTTIITDTSYPITGLNPGDLIDVTVNVLSDSRCPTSFDLHTCEAVECPAFDISIQNTTLDICVDGSNTPIDLMASATGGTGDGVYTWSGDGVTGNQFDPNGLAEGTYEVFVNYQEDNCDGSESIMFNLTTVPTADFDVDLTNICVGSSVNLLFTGSQLPNQTLQWTSGGEMVVPGANADEYVATFNQVGDFDITLLVENGDCQSEEFTTSVTVEPELVFDNIECDESLDQISFTWNAVDCASEYEVFVDNVSQGIQTNTDFTVTGLAENQEVTIEVIAVSGCACGNVMQTRICEAQACPPIEVNLSAATQEFCLTSDLQTVEIIDEVIGSAGTGTESWTGTAVTADGIFDPVAAGAGEHTIYYGFTETAGCDYQDSITFTVNESPEVSFAFEDITCYDQDSTTVELTPTGGDGNYSVLVNGNPSSLISDLGPGNYNIVVTDGNDCPVTTSFAISQPIEPDASIDGATMLINGTGSNYSIDASQFAGVSIDSVVWTANDSIICDDPLSCFSLTQAPSETTTYVVSVFYNDGCSVTSQLLVEVQEPEPVSILEVPNVISPNDDGTNDEWIIVTNDEELVINSVKIYDRWGNMVFTVDEAFTPINTNITWDGRLNGKDIIPGVYVYMINFIQDGRVKTRSGDITILR